MPDLLSALQGHDLGFLRIVAELWNIPFNAPDVGTGVNRLLPCLMDDQLIQNVIQGLAGEARQALDDLLNNNGQMPWALFTRRYGSIQEIGPGRRDRQQPYRDPSSACEALWYRALIGRAFLDSPSGVQEFAFIPDELVSLLPVPQTTDPQPFGRPASPGEKKNPLAQVDFLLDDACTLLAATRIGFPVEKISLKLANPGMPQPLTQAALEDLLSAAGLLDGNGMPIPESTRDFLEARRADALAWLARAWLISPIFNELHHVPGLLLEGEWSNDPLRTRRFLLEQLSHLPTTQWWSLPSFLAGLRRTHPDFQRPSGDYDSWYVRDVKSKQYLRGFGHWDEVDGALVRYLICGPMYWLGFMELSLAESGSSNVSAFRFSKWAESLLSGNPPEGFPEEEDHFQATSDGTLRLSPLCRRSLRYQVARFCQWLPEKDDAYSYRIIPASLERAREQGLRIPQLVALIQKYAQPVPPVLLQSLQRFDSHGVEARLEKLVVIRLTNPEILRILRQSRAARFLGEPLGPASVIVKPGAMEKVLTILAELGYLAEVDLEEEIHSGE